MKVSRRIARLENLVEQARADAGEEDDHVKRIAAGIWQSNRAANSKACGFSSSGTSRMEGATNGNSALAADQPLDLRRTPALKRKDTKPIECHRNDD